MKYLLLSLATLFSSQTFAKDLDLHCVVTANGSEVLQTEVKLAMGQRNVLFGESQDYQFFLSSNGNEAVELQVFNPYEPSRSYASTKLTEVNSFVELSIWKRDLLLEVRCASN